MQRRSRTAPWKLLVLTLLLLSAPVAIHAQQVRFAPESLPDSLAELLDEGRDLEVQDRWSDAISHYKDALEDHPGQQELKQRLDWSKIHYDLGRRSNDRSFRQAQTTIDPNRALDAYSEVLLKINAHHVAAPQWSRIVGRGTTALDIALADADFRKTHLRGVSEERIDRFGRQMHQNLASRSFRSRHDARLAVSSVCELAQDRLGLSATVVALEYVCGAAGGLDTYSAFLTGDQLRDVYSQIEGNFVGLGIELKADDGALLLVHVIPGSPAKEAGMKSGDRITEVDGQTTAGLSTDGAAGLLLGEEGTTVRVTVESPGQAPRPLASATRAC